MPRTISTQASSPSKTPETASPAASATPPADPPPLDVSEMPAMPDSKDPEEPPPPKLPPPLPLNDGMEGVPEKEPPGKSSTSPVVLAKEFANPLPVPEEDI